jgi:hypothetical protein
MKLIRLEFFSITDIRRQEAVDHNSLVSRIFDRILCGESAFFAALRVYMIFYQIIKINCIN